MRDFSNITFIHSLYFCWLLLIWLFFEYTPTNDGLGYIELAEMCLAEGQPYPTLSTMHYDSLPFIWNIGIINLTALSIALFGNILPLFPLFCLMKALTAWMMAKTAAKLFSERIALIALLLYIFYPNNWGQSTMISSEIPADFLTMTAVFLIVRFPEKTKIFFISGLILGISNWFRPTALIFIVAITIWLVTMLRWQSWRPLLLVMAGYACFILAVGADTYARTGHFVYQARSLWFSMIDECYDGAEVGPHWGQPTWPEGYPRYIENHEQLDCFECERIWKERSISWLKDHKLEYLKKIPGRIYYMYQSDYDFLTAFLPDKERAEDNFIIIPYRHLLSEASSLTPVQWLALLTMLFYAGLLVSAVCGSVAFLRQGHYQALLIPLSVIILGTLMLTFATHGETRFKTPFMPFIFMLAAAGLSLVNRKQIK
jgi:hypothetical protein